MLHLARPHDETLRDRLPTELAQPSKRMTRRMTQDPRLGQDKFIVNASDPIIP